MTADDSLLEAYWYIATGKYRKINKNQFWGILGQITIFGHLGLKKYVFRYISAKNDHLTADDGLLEDHWYIATRKKKSQFKITIFRQLGQI